MHNKLLNFNKSIKPMLLNPIQILFFYFCSMIRRLCFFIVFTTSGILFSQQKVVNAEFDHMLQKLLSHKVSEISVTEVVKDTSVIYLDAREKAEFNVSHINNAQWIGYNDFSILRLKSVPKNSKIIVYCSVGYRSEKIAKKLEKSGFTDVYNLYGGIFEWKHQNNPVFNAKKETDSIHTYNKEWSKWLTNGIKVY